MAFYKRRSDKVKKHFVYWREKDFTRPDARNSRAYTNKQRSKSFKTKPEALRFLAGVESQTENPATIGAVSFFEAGNNWLESVKGTSSPFTYVRYRGILGKFRDHSGNIDFPVNQISPELIESYKGSLADLAPRTVRTELLALSSFFSFCIRRDYMPGTITTTNGQKSGNPVAVIDRPNKRGRTTPKIPPDKILYKIFAESEKAGNLTRHCQISLAYYAGLRRAEIIRIKLYQINTEAGIIALQSTKGDKPRNVPISAALAETLASYRSTLPDGGVWLFPSERGAVGGHACTRYGKAVNDWLKRTSGLQYVTLHTLRHCFASSLVKNGVSLRVVQELMGHSDIATTQVYLHFQSNEAPQAVELLALKGPRP